MPPLLVAVHPEYLMPTYVNGKIHVSPRTVLQIDDISLLRVFAVLVAMLATSNTCFTDRFVTNDWTVLSTFFLLNNVVLRLGFFPEIVPLHIVIEMADKRIVAITLQTFITLNTSSVEDLV